MLFHNFVKRFLMKYLFSVLIVFILISGCARVGQPTGGKKDKQPPVLLISIPKPNAVNFKGNEIILQFDEYVTLKNPEKNILISPPLQNPPVIKPAGIASKIIKIEFKDSLQPQTTYQINFGESIADYNEGNKLKNLHLVFSTGPSIDSLQLKGTVKPVHYDKKPEAIMLALYQAKQFTDSLIFNTKPYYVSIAQKDGSFLFDHLKPGSYYIFALEDKNGDYKYKQGTEGIGFLKHRILVPKDSIVHLNLFKEYPPFQIENIEQTSRNHLRIKYKGHPDSLKVIWDMPVKQNIIQKQNNKADIWYMAEGDSIKMHVPVINRIKKYYRKRKNTIDSLKIWLPNKANLNPVDTVWLKANQPVQSVNAEKIYLNADSIKQVFKLKKEKNRFYFDFEKKPAKTYKITLLPEAVTGFLNEKNKDTLQMTYKIPKKESFGTLLVHLNTQKTEPVFVEVLKNGKIIRQTATQKNTDFKIPYLKPGTYQIRIVFDKNENNRWDTGNYLKHILPEAVFEPQKTVEIRANWDINQIYDLDN